MNPYCQDGALWGVLRDVFVQARRDAGARVLRWFLGGEVSGR